MKCNGTPIRRPRGHLASGGIGFATTFIAKLIVERLPARVHTAMLDAVAIVGGGMMIFGALRG
jgi:hypothetical protein